MTQKRQKPDVATYIGKGKIEELSRLIDEEQANVVIVDDELHPAQVRNLEKQTQTKVVDRTELILDIFATRAQTEQSKLQVELAQLEYLRPRLKRLWTHLETQGGGIGTRGPGETQLETDRRLIDKRIRELRDRLSTIKRRKEREVQARQVEFRVSLVGYTNAGKSTLMRALTGADVLVADMLFATLDTVPVVGRYLVGERSFFPTPSASSVSCRTTWSNHSRRRWKRRYKRICCCMSSMPPTRARSLTTTQWSKSWRRSEHATSRRSSCSTKSTK